MVELLFKKQNGLCACCGAILGATYHIEHIMPLTLGGKHADENLQLLLPRCNMQKYNMHPEKFRARRVKEGVAYEKNKEYNACSPGQSGASD
jgi:5-methylcytosine-specific restriction endonuclease McrA